jgi:hypothetical protein
MKKSEIKKGGFYSDGKLGVREVLDEGAQYKLYDAVTDTDCLRYRVLSGQAGSPNEQHGNMTRTSFATWAKAEIPAEQVERFLIDLQATKILGKLTEPQLVFLKGFDSDLTTTESSECGRSEFRAAVACRDKGLIAEMPASLAPNEKYFDVVFTELGLAVLAGVLKPVAVE